jgi:hypothetical protein
MEHKEDTKAAGRNVEFDNDGSSSGPLILGSAYRKKVERRLVMKLDIKMSLLVVIYILNYIDRSNAAAAR